MKLSKFFRGTILFYNCVVVFGLLTILLLRNTLQVMSFIKLMLVIPIGLYFVFSLIDHVISFSHPFIHPLLRLAHQTIALYSLIITCLFFLALITNVASTSELIFTMVLLPLPAFLFYTYWQKSAERLRKYKRVMRAFSAAFGHKSKSNKTPIISSVPEPTMTEQSEEASIVTSLPMLEDSLEPEIIVDPPTEQDHHSAEKNYGLKNILDMDRRNFLKLVAGSSLGFTVLSLVMPSKAQAAFFGSVPGPGVVALKDSTGVKIDPKEKNPTDGYSISEIDDNAVPSYYGFVDKDGKWYISKEVTAGSYRYAKGAASFATNWTGRAALTYDYFDNVF